MVITITKAAARRFLLHKQGLLPGDGQPCWAEELQGEAGVLAAIQRLEALQVDPIAVVERNHHLVLRNRVGGYRPEQLDSLFAARRVMEYLVNARCILPITDLPDLWPIMQAARQLPARAPLAESLAEVLSHLEAQGESQPRALGQGGPRLMGMGYNPPDKASKASGRAVDLLWLGGEIMVSRREGNEKWYDLAARVVPPEVAAQLPEGALLPDLPRPHYAVPSDHAGDPITRRERLSLVGEGDLSRPWGAPTVASEAAPWQSFLLDMYMRAYRLADLGDFRFGWQSYTAAERKALAADRVARGEWVEVAVEGVRRRYYALAEDRPLLEAAAEWGAAGPVRFLAPLDNLLWRRPRLQDLFEFDYTWEVYTPAAKRRFGYYALPILYGDRLIGRMDPKLDRQRGVLMVNLLQLEQGVAVDEELTQHLAAALWEFARWHGADGIELRATDPPLLLDRLHI